MDTGGHVETRTMSELIEVKLSSSDWASSTRPARTNQRSTANGFLRMSTLLTRIRLSDLDTDRSIARS